jgi:phosphatidate cytidylyltransferase|tara:strand:- start:580 stop:1230 length:651 start_codon:yes stop_codon:yes gene_type:complete
MVYKTKAYNFILRLITACILAPIILFSIKLSGFTFLALVIVAAVIMGGEWSQMTYRKNNIWKLAGIPYIMFPCLSLIWLIEQSPSTDSAISFNGVSMIISIFVLVWANDIGGYVFGKTIGGPKLCAKISPNKTISGFIGGVLCSMALAPLLNDGLLFGAAIAIIASIGDLLESWFKRKFKVKDSGSILPGHGGLLDRVDGILLVVVVVAATSILFK